MARAFRGKRLPASSIGFAAAGPTGPAAGPDDLMESFRRARHHSRRLFDLVVPEAYHARPLPLRHPIVFYEGHLPAFAVNTLVRWALGGDGVDGGLEQLFARGIDPDDEGTAAASAPPAWPARDRVQAYADAADRVVLDALAGIDLHDDGERGTRAREAAFAVLEHELMHQETLLYILHRLPWGQKRRPADGAPVVGDESPVPRTVRVPRGRATLGTDRAGATFAWDNEQPPVVVDVAAFEIDVHDVTNARYLEFVDAGGYDDPTLWTPEAWRWLASHGRHPLFWEQHDGRWYWRGLFEPVPLPAAWPVYVTHAEAAAFARWQGARLPTEAEFHRAAFGAPDGGERLYPWGAAPPDATRGNFDFRHWDPVPAGSHPDGASAWGVHDLVGNGWEWTSTIFAPFEGFRPMPSYPGYSKDFFDDQHLVLKGASAVTAARLLRRSFRNWFRPHYPYPYATFRCVRPVDPSSRA
jgi:gamma-glutamyl hercynylcysteine S-oxide synthase